MKLQGDFCNYLFYRKEGTVILSRGNKISKLKDDSKWAWTMLLPNIIGFVLFMLVPEVATFVLSFTKYVSGLRVYASLQNFITITSYSGDNPEVSKYGQDNLGAGYDAFSYPFAKSVLFGLNVKF